MSGVGQVGGGAGQIDDTSTVEMQPPPEAPQEAPQIQQPPPNAGSSGTGAALREGAMAQAALLSRLGQAGQSAAPVAQGPIPPQSNDPRVAINQNHNINAPNNVVGRFDVTHPTQVNTPQQVLDQIGQMADHWSSQPPPQNSLGVFPTAYREMTTALAGRAEQYLANGEPEKAQAIYDVMVQFANRFFQAFDSYQSGDMANVPGPWRTAFDHGLETPPPSVASNLGMAMNAHILNDLPQTLRDLSAAGRPGFDLNSETDRAAFREYNDTFADARLDITGALNRAYPGNDVGTVAGMAESLGLGQFGVGQAVDLMRTKAWDDAADPSVTPQDLSRNTSRMSEVMYEGLRAAHRAREAVTDVVDTARDLGGRAVNKAREVASDVEDEVRDLGSRAENAWNDFWS